MSGYGILPDGLDSVVKDLEQRVIALSKKKNISSTVTIGQNFGNFEFSPLGSALYVDTFVSGTSFEIQANGASPGTGTSVEVRYYQQVPRIYTDAQITAGTDYTVLGNTVWIGGSIFPVPVMVPFDFTCAISESIRGTYGAIKVMFTTAIAPPVEPVLGILWTGFTS